MELSWLYNLVKGQGSINFDKPKERGSSSRYFFKIGTRAGSSWVYVKSLRPSTKIVRLGCWFCLRRVRNRISS